MLFRSTNMPPALRDGYYLQKKKMTDGILAGEKPLATVMTDAKTQQAIFIDIPVLKPNEKGAETFIVSNLIPFEINGKAYLWICSVDLKEGGTTFVLPPSDASGRVKTCDVVVRDLPKCEGGSCRQ